MQRIYGTAWFDKKDLKNYLQMREEAKERDHRKLGKDLDLFMISQRSWSRSSILVAKWCDHPSWVGTLHQVDKEVAAGYQHVYTPPIASVELYKTSGHWDHYREDMFPPMDMGMEKSLFFVQWTALTTLKSTNTMCTLTANCQSVSLKSVWCTVMKNLVPLQDFNVCVKCPEWWSYLCGSRTNRGRIQEDPSIDHRCV